MASSTMASSPPSAAPRPTDAPPCLLWSERAASHGMNSAPVSARETQTPAVGAWRGAPRACHTCLPRCSCEHCDRNRRIPTNALRKHRQLGCMRTGVGGGRVGFLRSNSPHQALARSLWFSARRGERKWRETDTYSQNTKHVSKHCPGPDASRRSRVGVAVPVGAARLASWEASTLLVRRAAQPQACDGRCFRSRRARRSRRPARRARARRPARWRARTGRPPQPPRTASAVRARRWQSRSRACGGASRRPPIRW